MLSVIVFIIILGLLVFVHELGHFVVARRNGIKAEEFGFGFPPRIAGFVKSEKTGKFRWVKGNKEIESKNTVYSINWIPLGGFVRIKGEDGSGKKDPDSFASKSAWARTKVLAAGVMMNFVLAWVLLSLGLMIGVPEAIEAGQNVSSSKIQISSVTAGSPAAASGLKVGDEILKDQTNAGQKTHLNDTQAVQDYISANKGKQMTLDIKRGNESMAVRVAPRVETPQGQGPLGVTLTETAIARYPWYEAVWKGLTLTLDMISAILVALWGIIAGLFAGQGVSADLAGPVGIAVLTKQVTGMGFVYILQFAALLSINLGIINILPIPALDGGRILFVLIEKIKGRPVSQKLEQAFHTAGFFLLILLLILISFRDVTKLIK